MDPNCWTELILSLLFFTCPLVPPVWAKTGPAQLVCYSASDSHAKNIHLIWRHSDDKKLWERNGKPLQSCSGVSASELDSCLACLEKDRVFAKCLLTDPSAHLDFAAINYGEYLNKTQVPCDLITTTAPTTSAPATASTPSPPAGGAHTGPVLGGVFVLLVVAVSAVVVYICKKKNNVSWRNCCRYTSVSKSDNDAGTV